MTKEKDYQFEIKISLDIDIPAISEEEARGKIGEYIAEYFADTEVSINEEEAKLLQVHEN